MDHQEFVAELSKNIPESWDSEDSMESIIIAYLHALEVRIEELCGSLEHYPWKD